MDVTGAHLAPRSIFCLVARASLVVLVAGIAHGQPTLSPTHELSEFSRHREIHVDPVSAAVYVQCHNGLRSSSLPSLGKTGSVSLFLGTLVCGVTGIAGAAVMNPRWQESGLHEQQPQLRFRRGRGVQTSGSQESDHETSCASDLGFVAILGIGVLCLVVAMATRALSRRKRVASRAGKSLDIVPLEEDSSESKKADHSPQASCEFHRLDSDEAEPDAEEDLPRAPIPTSARGRCKSEVESEYDTLGAQFFDLSTEGFECHRMDIDDPEPDAEQGLTREPTPEVGMERCKSEVEGEYDTLAAQFFQLSSAGFVKRRVAQIECYGADAKVASEDSLDSASSSDVHADAVANDFTALAA